MKQIRGLAMNRLTVLVLGTLILATAGADDKVPAHPYVEMETSEGTIRLELDGLRAPLTVANFLKLVDSGYYNGTIFHRVIPDFMIQGGAYTPDLKDKEPEGSIPNESGNGLRNDRGTIAMARLGQPHTAYAQFYINVADNQSLNPNPSSWGYAVFGYVIEGMDVVDRIVLVPTGPAGRFKSDVPVAPVIIKKLSRFEFE
jgi:cyclophilin family peptidyl-prolyl cis-trans isomerase